MLRRTFQCAHRTCLPAARQHLPARTCLHPHLPAPHRALCACSKQTPPPPPAREVSATPAACGSGTPGGDSSEFWKSRPVWRRAAANTLRCLVGCSVGDLSALWLLQTHAPALSVTATVAAACAAGIGTSLALETVVLRATEGFAWPLAARTAWNMSLVRLHQPAALCIQPAALCIQPTAMCTQPATRRTQPANRRSSLQTCVPSLQPGVSSLQPGVPSLQPRVPRCRCSRWSSPRTPSRSA